MEGINIKLQVATLFVVVILGLQALLASRHPTDDVSWIQVELKPRREAHEQELASREGGFLGEHAPYREHSLALSVESADSVESAETEDFNASDLGFSNHTPQHLALLASEVNTAVLASDPSQSAEFSGIEESTPQHLLHHQKMMATRPREGRDSDWHPDSRGHSRSLHDVSKSPDAPSLDTPATSALADHTGYAPH